MFAVAFATILTLDQLITFGLSALFGRGGGVGTWLLLLVCMLSCRVRFSGRALFFIFTSLLLLVIPIREINFSTIYLTGLITLSLVVFASRMDVPLAGSSAFIRGLEAVLIGRILSMFGFDFFEIISGLEVNRPCGFYSEPSHFAFYVAILYLLAVLSRPQDRLRAAVISIVALSVTFSASALLPIGIVLYDITRNARHRKLMWACSCVGAFTLLIFQSEYLLQRTMFVSGVEASLTLQVLIYYYDLFALHLVTAPLTAFGPDRFRDAYDWYSNQLGLMPDNLNSTDGSFLAVKLLVEYGLPFLVMLLIVLYWRVRQTGAIAVGLLLTQYIFLRGFGLTSSVVIALVLIAAAQSQRASVSQHHASRSGLVTRQLVTTFHRI